MAGGRAPPFVGALDAGLAVEGLDAVVESERCPAVGLDPLPAESEHTRDGGLEVVVADHPSGDPTEDAERVGMPLEEGLLPGSMPSVLVTAASWDRA